MTTGRDVTVEIGDTGAGVAVLLDDATSKIIELESRGYQPRQLSVSAATYECISQVRVRDLERGLPLIVLGLMLVSTEAE